MTIRYALSESELLRWMWRRQMRQSKQFMIWMGLIGLGVVATGEGFARFLGIVLLLWTIAAPFQARKDITQRIQQDPESTGPITIDFDHHGLKYIRSSWKA